ncbi:MAG: PDZ domain-containing protein [Candidatus Eremiobacteraeota bacterium]|nr:PDZ domain-containing protein [Candidatus Eremiobacteraeota bacterium]
MTTTDRFSFLRRWKFVASATLAIVLFVFSAMHSLDWNPAHYGEFGLNPDSPPIGGPTVTGIATGSPAERAGIRIGDVVVRPSTLRDRLLVQRWFPPKPGERITFAITRGVERRTVTLEARRAARLSPTDAAGAILLAVVFLVFTSIGLVLVLLRPSRMTWAFYLVAYALASALSLYFFFIQLIPPAWQVALMEVNNVFVDAGAIGFLIFCLRFPADAPTGWRRTLERFAPYVLIMLWSVNVARDLGVMNFWPDREVASLTQVFNFTWLIMFIVGTGAFLATYFSARGPEKHKVKWVALGFVLTFVAALPGFAIYEGIFNPPQWMNGLISLLYLPLPLAIAYAIIRHRVIDVRFIASRSLVIGVIAAIIALTVVAVDWLFSTKLPSSRLEGAVYVGIALLIGLSLNAARQRIGKTVDAIFFRQWHRTQEKLEVLADAIRRARLKSQLYEPITAGLAGALGLGSTALFERVDDGGFVRVAAANWPTGTLWHILPDDPLARRANGRVRVVDIDAFQWHENNLPAGIARPSSMVPIVAGRQVAAILLCGAHENGTALDPDEMRIIRRLVSDAGVLYASSGQDIGLMETFDARIASASV